MRYFDFPLVMLIFLSLVTRSAYAEQALPNPDTSAAVQAIDEIPSELGGLLLKEDSGMPFLVTGNRSMEDRSKVLALSVVNPPLPEAIKANLFSGDKTRPRTWDEANLTCSLLGLAKNTWRLPTIKELSYLNSISNYRYILWKGDDKMSALRGNLSQLREQGARFHFLWTADSKDGSDNRLKLAAFFSDGDVEESKFQSMSKSSLLSTLCVTHFSAANAKKIATITREAQAQEKVQ